MVLYNSTRRKSGIHSLGLDGVQGDDDGHTPRRVEVRWWMMMFSLLSRAAAVVVI